MWKMLREAWRYRFVCENFVKTSLGNKYKRNVLGYLWSVLLPLARFFFMGFVFAFVIKTRDPKYLALFMTGSVLYQLMSSAIVTGSRAFISNAHYIKKIYVPKLIFVGNVVLLELVNTLLVLAALAILGLATGNFAPTWQSLWAIPGLAVVLLFLCGIVPLLGVGMVWFNDIQYIVEIIMQTVYFVTPIMFPASMIPEYLYAYNPFYYMVEIVRQPLLEGVVPSAATWAVAGAIAAASAVLGLAVLARKQDDIVFRL